jgi:uncharacterized membrane protein
MPNESTIIFGIEIPSTSPTFLTVVGFHIAVGLAAVVAGMMAMFSKKGRGRHSAFGEVYFWLLLMIFVSATFLAAMRWAEDYHLFILGSLSFAAAYLGRTAVWLRLRNWVKLHIVGMGTSYVLMLTAFYVDNGKMLPIWKELPPIAYWLLPGAVGIPLIARALLGHPLARNPSQPAVDG